jgi:hypothetical protein
MCYPRQRPGRSAAALALAAALAAVLCLSACSPAAPGDFQGEWVWSDGTAYFGLTLQVDGAALSGWHDGGLADGSRIDTSVPGDEPTVSGTVEGRVARIKITSVYSPELAYEATLTLEGTDKAAWKVTKAMDGETYIPREAALVRAAATTAAGPAEKPDESALIKGCRALVDGLDRDIGERGFEAMKFDAPGSSEGGEALVWREGQVLLKISVVRYGETGRLESSYWFGPNNVLALTRRTMYAVEPSGDSEIGSLETTAWYFKDGAFACARDGQDNPIVAGSPDAGPALEAIAADVAAFRDKGGEQ